MASNHSGVGLHPLTWRAIYAWPYSATEERASRTQSEMSHEHDRAVATVRAQLEEARAETQRAVEGAAAAAAETSHLR
jgi:hypothetical protein